MFIVDCLFNMEGSHDTSRTEHPSSVVSHSKKCSGSVAGAGSPQVSVTPTPAELLAQENSNVPGPDDPSHPLRRSVIYSVPQFATYLKKRDHYLLKSFHSKHHYEQTKESDKKVKSTDSKARKGLLGKACKILTSSGIAPNTSETWNLLQQKHPKGPIPTPPDIILPSGTPALPPEFNIIQYRGQRYSSNSNIAGGSLTALIKDKEGFTLGHLPYCSWRGSKNAIRHAITLIQKLGLPLGLWINHAKCELFFRTVFSGFPQEMKVSHEPNFEVLGAPIGDPIFCAKFLVQKCAKAAKLLSQLATVGSLDRQVALLLLHQCAGYCKLVHLTRSTPPPITSDGLALSDADVRHCFLDCTGVDTAVTLTGCKFNCVLEGEVLAFAVLLSTLQLLIWHH
eukprot:Em0022g668a